jgi:outer membrane protein TolC
MDAVVDAVLRHNDRAAAAEYMTRAAERKARSAGAWSDPMLMVGVTNLPTTRNFSEDLMTMKMVGISQAIPLAGQKGLEAAAARADAEAAHQSELEEKLELVTAAEQAYCEYYYRQGMLADLKTQRELALQIANSAEGRLRAGQAGQEDVSAARADLWRLDASILSAEQELDAARYELGALSGTDPDQPFGPAAEPTFTALPASVDTWESLARDHYPPLARFRQTRSSLAYSAAAASRMRWPELSLYANYGFRADGPEGPRDNMIGFGAEISLPLFSRASQGAMSASMREMAEGTDALAAQLWRDVRSRLRILHARATRLTQSLDLYRTRIIPAADDALRSALGGYAAGRISFSDLAGYASMLYTDRINAQALALEFARNYIEAGKYTRDPAAWQIDPSARDNDSERTQP